MEHTLQASLHHTQVCKCISVAVQLGWTHHWTSGNHFWSHHPIKQALGVLWDFLKIQIFLLSIWLEWKQKPVGVVLFRNREITRGQGFVWRVRDCLCLGQEPYGLQLINTFGHVIQDFSHTSTSPLGTGRRDFFFLVRIRAVGNAALSTCGFPQGRSLCVCVCSYYELRSTFSLTRQ